MRLGIKEKAKDSARWRPRSGSESKSRGADRFVDDTEDGSTEEGNAEEALMMAGNIPVPSEEDISVRKVQG